ncbi:hypothetical protein ACFPRL_19780 [Pseudoclavibacter helvolus]
MTAVRTRMLLPRPAARSRRSPRPPSPPPLTLAGTALPQARDGFHARGWLASHPEAWKPSRNEGAGPRTLKRCIPNRRRRPLVRS